MTIYDFIHLNKHNKEKASHDKTCIATRLERGAVVELHYIDNYFVEICYKANENSIFWVQLSKKPGLLEAYVKNVNLKDLIDFK